MSSYSSNLSNRYKGSEENIWVRFTGLAAKHNACNMGQGFPDFCLPTHIRQGLANATMSDNPLLNQYTRGYGSPVLVNNLAKLYSKEFDKLIDPMKEILVSSGAYEALYCAFQSLLNPGDEVIIIEPFFDCYEPMALTAGAKPVFVPLEPHYSSESGIHSSGDWKLDPKKLEAAFSSKTKFLVLNSPNNPLGKTYTEDELKMISEMCVNHGAICISDEVYEWMAIPPNKHLRIANMPGMWDRTITIGSAGKTFNATGWKLGWAIGPENLIKCLQIAHQNCVYTCCTPVQEAVGVGLEYEMKRMDRPDCYLKSVAAVELKTKRDMMADVLRSSGLNPVVPEGGYFMIADISKHLKSLPEPVTDEEKDMTNDYRFAIWLVENMKLATIPVSCFYSDEHKHFAENYIRFCYYKKEETLRRAKSILQGIDWSKFE